MSYSLSFSPEFFYGNELDQDPEEKSNRPKSVYQALISMDKRDWNEMAKEVFGVSGNRISVDDVMQKIRDTDSCSGLRSPVEVWIDRDGFYTVDVYE